MPPVKLARVPGQLNPKKADPSALSPGQQYNQNRALIPTPCRLDKHSALPANAFLAACPNGRRAWAVGVCRPSSLYLPRRWAVMRLVPCYRLRVIAFAV